MYLYFFDLDDTICNTAQAIKDIELKYNLNRADYASDKEYYDVVLEEKLQNYGLDNISILENSTVSLLQQLIKDKSQDVYYITARESKVRDSSVLWLKKHNLWLGEQKLLMDTQAIKGKTINNILSDSDKQFAFLFDDLIDNHKEAAPYKKIISCFPF